MVQGNGNRMRRTPRVRGRIVNFNNVCRHAGAVITAYRVNLAVQGSGSEFLAGSGHRRQRLPSAASLGRSATHKCEPKERSQDAGCLFHKRVQRLHVPWASGALYNLPTGNQTQGSQNIREFLGQRDDQLISQAGANEAISYLDKIENLHGVPASTRNWNAIEEVAEILETNQ
jgi:hypothetical protein